MWRYGWWSGAGGHHGGAPRKQLLERSNLGMDGGCIDSGTARQPIASRGSGLKQINRAQVIPWGVHRPAGVPG